MFLLSFFLSFCYRCCLFFGVLPGKVEEGGRGMYDEQSYEDDNNDIFALPGKKKKYKKNTMTTLKTTAISFSLSITDGQE